jgi:hypothetical protein
MVIDLVRQLRQLRLKLLHKGMPAGWNMGLLRVLPPRLGGGWTRAQRTSGMLAMRVPSVPSAHAADP